MMASEEAPEEKNLKECPSCWYRRICYTWDLPDKYK
jgi:CRISPR/Cas system-associated exonuclease Cas4 (RecB family)